MKLTYVSGFDRNCVNVDWSDKTIIFTHIPKAAGTTLDIIFTMIAKVRNENRRRAMGTFLGQTLGEEKAEALDYFRANITNSATPIRYLAGHLPYGIHDELVRESVYITVVRDPILRCISQFRMGISGGIWTEESSLDDLHHSGKMISNSQTRQLAGAVDPNTDCDEKLLETALNNIDQHYSLVATTEDFNQLIKALIALLDWPDLIFSNYQIGKAEISDARTSEIGKQAVRWNKLDLELYEAVSQRPHVWANGLFETDEPTVSAPGAEIMFVSEHVELELNNKPMEIIPHEFYADIQNELLKDDISIDHV